MTIDPVQIETLLLMLEGAPLRLTLISLSVEPERLHVRTDEEPWSANDILAHLRVCADVWTKSMNAMLTQDHPTLRYVSPRTQINKTNYREHPFDESLKVFAAQRAALLALLRPLSAEGWARGATFTGTTQGKNHNIFTYARRMVQHESGHCDQMSALLK